MMDRYTATVASGSITHVSGRELGIHAARPSPREVKPLSQPKAPPCNLKRIPDPSRDPELMLLVRRGEGKGQVGSGVDVRACVAVVGGWGTGLGRGAPRPSCCLCMGQGGGWVWVGGSLGAKPGLERGCS